MCLEHAIRQSKSTNMIIEFPTTSIRLWGWWCDNSIICHVVCTSACWLVKRRSRSTWPRNVSVVYFFKVRPAVIWISPSFTYWRREFLQLLFIYFNFWLLSYNCFVYPLCCFQNDFFSHIVCAHLKF